MGHLPVELLSALADGELDLSAERQARAHLQDCLACRGELAAFSRLDEALAEPQPLSTEQVAWAAAIAAIRALPPAMPSAATDAAIRRLTRPEPRRRTGRPELVRAFALRGAAAAALVLAIVIGLLPSAPDQARQEPTSQETVLVAGVQQMALFSRTNTLYVAQPAEAAVDALDAVTYELRTRIAIGGRPTALALHEPTSRLFVLDSAQKSLIEIDAERNAVVGSRSLESLPGTPTSLQVRADGRVVVSAIPDPAPAAPGPQATVAPSQSGLVAVIDDDATELQAVRTTQVAPSLIVSAPDGQQSLLVSRAGTALVDASFETRATLPGGIAAAFGADDIIAVLGEEPGNAVLHFYGDGAPGPLRLPGVPVALTPLPEGGFAVLLGSGSGNGRIVVVDEAGRAVGVTEIAQVGRDLTYDSKGRRFAVATGGRVSSASLPQGLALGRESTNGQQATNEPEQSLDAAASPSPDPDASPSPEVDQPVALEPVEIPPTAELVAADVHRIPIPDGKLPILIAPTPDRIWFMDQRGELNVLDASSGGFNVVELPKGARIGALAADRTRVYALDFFAGTLYSVSVQSGRVTSQSLPLFQNARSLAVSNTGEVWLGLQDPGHLLSIEPGGRMQVVVTDFAAIAAIAPQGGEAVWFSDGGNRIGVFELTGGRLTEFSLSTEGSAHLLLHDDAGTLWIGTTSGEVLAVRGGTVRLVASGPLTITSLALDRSGNPWYLGPIRSGAGSTLAPLGGSGTGRDVEAPLASLSFSRKGLTWAADASGAFYLVQETAE